VVRELESMPGLLTAFGVVGFWRKGPWMCTLSFWADLEDSVDFAYRGSPQHREALKRVRAGAYGGERPTTPASGCSSRQARSAGVTPSPPQRLWEHDFPL
jgi:hypothetical protein